MKGLAIVIILLSLSALFCGGAEPATHTVRYEVGGVAAAFVTYQNASGGTEQAEVSLPFSKQYTMPAGAFAYISAQNQGNSGTIYCRIFVDGNLWKESVSSGGYVIADCSGSVGD